MPGLHDLQRKFGAALLDARRSPPGDVTSHAVRHPLRRFNVYRNNVAGGLIELLQSYFPVVARLLGEEFFRATTAAYIKEDPPRSPILSRYGGGFTAFLRDFGPVSDLPYLADVARLEWLRLRAYHAADAALLSGDGLMCVPADRIAGMRLIGHPSLHLFSSDFPVVSIWRTNTHDEVVTPIDVAAGGEHALVVRPGLEVHIVPVSAGMQALAAALVAGEPLAAAAEHATERHPELCLQSALAMLIDAGTFVAFRFDDVGSLLPEEASP